MSGSQLPASTMPSCLIQEGRDFLALSDLVPAITPEPNNSLVDAAVASAAVALFLKKVRRAGLFGISGVAFPDMMLLVANIWLISKLNFRETRC